MRDSVKWREHPVLRAVGVKRGRSEMWKDRASSLIHELPHWNVSRTWNFRLEKLTPNLRASKIPENLSSIWKSGLVSWGRRRNSRNQNRAVTSEVSRVLGQRGPGKGKYSTPPIWQPSFTIVLKIQIWIWMLILATILPIAAVYCPFSRGQNRTLSEPLEYRKFALCLTALRTMKQCEGEPGGHFRTITFHIWHLLSDQINNAPWRLCSSWSTRRSHSSFRIVEMWLQLVTAIRNAHLESHTFPFSWNSFHYFSLWFLRSGRLSSSSNSLSCCLPCFPLSIGCFRLDHWHPHFYTINSQSQKVTETL